MKISRLYINISLLLAVIFLMGVQLTNAESTTSRVQKIVFSRIISDKLFMISYEQNGQKDISTPSRYININGTISGPYLGISDWNMNDDGSYSYTWIDTNKNVIVRHLVVNGYEYLPYIGDILWSPNKKHFAFMDKNKVVFVDGEKLNIHVQSTGISDQDFAVFNDGQILVKKFIDGVGNKYSFVDANDQVRYSFKDYGTFGFSKNKKHFYYQSFQNDSNGLKISLSIDGNNVGSYKLSDSVKSDSAKDIVFSQNEDHYIFAYEISNSSPKTLGVVVDGKVMSEIYQEVLLKDDSILDSGQYLFFGLEDNKTVVSNINGTITKYKRDNNLWIGDSKVYNNDFYFNFTESTTQKSETYKNQTLIAKDVFSWNFLKNILKEKPAAYFCKATKCSNNYFFYFGGNISGPFSSVLGVIIGNKTIYTNGSDLIIDEKIQKSIRWNNIQTVKNGFFSTMPDSNGLKNINGTIYKSLVSQDMYLSDDLLTAVYASGGKINIVPTSSTITVPDTPKITTILLDVTDDGSSLSLDQSKLDVAVNPNFEPILRKNEVDRITIGKTVISGNMGYFHKIRMNGFQGYPYTTQQPGINKMNEENAFVGYFKLPDGYSLTKVDAGPDFVTSVDQPNNRFFITPTKDRVIREMYAIDKPKIYDIKVFYQAGFGKENSAVAIGALEYSWGFNYERDAFSIENSSTVDSVSPDGQKFEHGGWEKLTLGNIKILFPDLDIYDGKNKLSLKELFDKKYELTNFKMSINTKEEILLKTKSMSFVYKGKELTLNKKTAFLSFLNAPVLQTMNWNGFCFGFAMRGGNYLWRNYKMTDWSKNSVYSIKSGSVFSKTGLEGKLGTEWNKEINLERLIGMDFVKQITGEFLSATKKIENQPESIGPIAINVKRGEKNNVGHAFFGYKTEVFSNKNQGTVNNFKIASDGEYVDLYFKDRCLSEVCHTDKKEKNDITSLKRIYVYDNSNPGYNLASIFIATEKTGIKYVSLNTGNGIYSGIQSNVKLGLVNMQGKNINTPDLESAIDKIDSQQ